MPPCQGGERGSIPLGRILTSVVKCATLNNMKNGIKIANKIIILVGVFVVPFIVFAAAPTITTNPASNVGRTEARLNGYVTASGLSPLVVWAELGTSSNNLDFSTPQRNVGSHTVATFSQEIINLQPNTLYYFRVVAQNPDGKTYGSMLNFRTGPGSGTGYSNSVNSGSTPPNSGSDSPSPGVTTMFATNITYNSLTFNGYVIPQGSNTYRWFEWGTTQILGNRSGFVFAGTQPNNFAFTATGLNPGTTYYFRAVAQNNAGVVQGSIFSATTLATNQSPVGTSSIMIAPLVSAKLPIGITATQATLNAVAIPGSASLVAGYFEWGNNSQTLANGTPPQSLQANGVVSFAQTINNLSPATTYYYRAVVQDANLTAYRSAIVSFNTPSRIATPPSSVTTSEGSPYKQPAPPAPKQTEPEENAGQQNGRGAAGAIFFGTPSAGLIGWLLVIVLLVVSAILSVMLIRCKKQPRATNGANGFREFPD